jgi:hypothetical protein
MMSKLNSQGGEEEQPENNLLIKEWRTPSLAPSDHRLESIEYESKELIQMPQKKPHGAEGDDPDCHPRVDVELQEPRVEPQDDPILDLNEDVEQHRLEVQ